MVAIASRAQNLRQPAPGVGLNPAHWLAGHVLFASSGTTDYVRGTRLSPPSTVRKVGMVGSGHHLLNPAVGLGGDGVGTGKSWLLTQPLQLPFTLSVWMYGAADTTSDNLLEVKSRTTLAKQLIRRSTNETLQARSSDAAGAYAYATPSAYTHVDNAWVHVVGVFASNASRIVFANGAEDGSNATSITFESDLDEVRVLGNNNACIAGIALPLVLDLAMTPRQVELLYLEQRRRPWALFAPRRRRLWGGVAAAPGADLECGLSGQCSVTAGITTSIRAASLAQSAAAITAELLTSIRLATSAAGQSAMAAALTTSIRPAATLTGQAAISAALTTGGAVFASGMAGNAQIAAAMTTSIRAAATLGGQASMAGTLTNVGTDETPSAGFKVSRLAADPRLPDGGDLRALKTRLYEVLRQQVEVVNAHDDGYVSAVVEVSADYSVQRPDGVVLVDASSGQVTITLQAPAEGKHKPISVRKVDSSSNQVVVRSPTGRVDGASTLVLSVASPRVTLASSGASYFSV